MYDPEFDKTYISFNALSLLCCATNFSLLSTPPPFRLTVTEFVPSGQQLWRGHSRTREISQVYAYTRVYDGRTPHAPSEVPSSPSVFPSTNDRSPAELVAAASKRTDKPRLLNIQGVPTTLFTWKLDGVNTGAAWPGDGVGTAEEVDGFLCKRIGEGPLDGPPKRNGRDPSWPVRSTTPPLNGI